MKHLIFSLLLMSLSGMAFSQSTTESVFSVADSLAWESSLSATGADGWSGIDRSYLYYERMGKVFTDKELDSLARRHDSPIVRAAAGWILIDRRSPLASILLFDRLTDTATFILKSYDVGTPCNVATYLVDCASTLLSPRDSLRLDSVLLSSSDYCHINYRDKLIRSLPAIPENYPRVKHLYENEHTRSALATLARYHKEEDVPLILQALSSDNPFDLESGFEAIAAWPDARFHSVLASKRSQFLQEEVILPVGMKFFLAVMAYRDSWSRQFIKETFAMVEKHPNNVPDPYFENIGCMSQHWGEYFWWTCCTKRDTYYKSLFKKYAKYDQ